MNEVTISFEYEGKIYKGIFKPVSGSGTGVWHLIVGNYYRGTLQLTNNSEWVFHGNKFKDMAEYFGNYLTLWYE